MAATGDTTGTGSTGRVASGGRARATTRPSGAGSVHQRKWNLLLLFLKSRSSKANRSGFTGGQRVPPPQRLLREDPRRSEAEQRDAGEEAAGQWTAGAAQPRVRHAPPVVPSGSHDAADNGTFLVFCSG